MRRPPKPKIAWRKMDTSVASRFKTRRARFRAKHDKTFAETGRWIRSIREQMGKTQKEFAFMVGVSVITLRRWELGWGHAPSLTKRRDAKGKLLPSNRERLVKIAKMVESLKASGAKVRV
jgi:DNA-binding transcriptional regulator YiaG